MSDDEDYVEVAPPEEEEEVEPVPADSDEEDLALDEDAAGSDGGESSGDEAPAAQKASPAKPKADALLKNSNKSRTNIIMPAADRVTSNWLTKGEMALVLAMRAKQIADHPSCFVPTTGVHDPVELARAELYKRRCPLILRRVVGRGPEGEDVIEEWPVREMTLPPHSAPGGSDSS